MKLYRRSSPPFWGWEQPHFCRYPYICPDRTRTRSGCRPWGQASNSRWGSTLDSGAAARSGGFGDWRNRVTQATTNPVAARTPASRRRTAGRDAGRMRETLLAAAAGARRRTSFLSDNPPEWFTGYWLRHVLLFDRVPDPHLLAGQGHVHPAGQDRVEVVA